MNAFFRSSAVLALAFVAATSINAIASAQVVIYVDIKNGSLNPPDNGTLGWGTDAFRFLQDALAAADGQFPSEQNPVEIWVAATGHYRPDQRADNGPGASCPPYGDCDRTDAFELRNHVAILGGFDGTEALRSERRPLENVTVLSGALKCEDPIGSPCQPAAPQSDNSANVVRSIDNDSTARLDGFHIIDSRSGVIAITTGLFMDDSDAIISNCTFRGHNGDPISNPAAMKVHGGAPKVINCVFYDNVSPDHGIIQSSFWSDLTMINCLVYDNDSDVAVFASGGAPPQSMTIVNCTIANNSGHGLRVDNTAATISNSIIWGHVGDTGTVEDWQLQGSNITVSHSTIEGIDVYDDVTNQGADPNFVDWEAGDYRLRFASPCIDVGDHLAVPADAFDIDENGITSEPVPDLDWSARIKLTQVDMGAFESQFSCSELPNAVFPDCNDDGIPDECELLDGAADCNGNGIPDECDLKFGFSQDCNDNGVPDTCDIASGISRDCNYNNIPDECEIADGAPHCNGVLEECLFPCGEEFAIDVVLVLDTSGSLGNGGEYTGADGICSTIVASLENHLTSNYPHLSVNVAVLELGNSNSTCGSSNFVTFFGGAPLAVPGDNGMCISEVTVSNDEAWGTASSIVAAAYPWNSGSLRIAIPISDEAPCDGDACQSGDADSIANAIALSLVNHVIVLPITGAGSSQCVMDYADELSIGTHGDPAFHRELTSYSDIGAALISRIDSLIAEIPSCECECECYIDLNCDGVVDVSDLLILLGEWGECADPHDCPADLNDDGTVDVSDLLILLNAWGDGCGFVAGDDVPETVQDCYDEYFDPLDPSKYEDCIQWLEMQDNYLE